MTMKTAEGAETAEMVQAANANRRTHERVTATFDVRFLEAEDAARALRAYSLNLSAGGLCLRTRRSYDVGAIVRLQMTVSGEDFDLEGIISWVRDDAEAIGVRFINVSDANQARLQRVVTTFKR